MDNLTEQERIDRYKDLDEEPDNNSNDKNKRSLKQFTNDFISVGFLHRTFYILAVIFLVIGFYKLLVYDLDGKINAYVGGDAYNFIINACKATAYFILSLIFFVQGNFVYSNLYKSK